MRTILSGIAALLFALLWGGAPMCGAVLFAILGLFLCSKIAGIRLAPASLPRFVLYMVLGSFGEVLSFLFASSGGMAAAWLLFSAAAFLTSLSTHIRGAVRKAVLLLYLCLCMLLQMHAEGSIEASGHFLALQTANLTFAAYSISALPKRKNDA